MTKNSKNFALLGSSGYIGRKHVATIKDLKKKLILAYDPHNNSGYLDSFFPECDFANSEKDFFSSVKKKKISYVVVCTPNYLHYPHIKKSLINGANVICEKPTVMSIKQLKNINKLEKKYKRKCYSIFQLRYNSNIIRLKSKIIKLKKFSNILLNYITYRGKWYEASWKSNLKHSGGLIMNIGVHFVDILTFLFGKLKNIKLDITNKKTLKGTMYFYNAKIKFLLSIEKKFLKNTNKPVRKILFNNSNIDLTSRFTDLHIKCYKEILSGRGIMTENLILTYDNLKVIQNEIKK
tara:strand:+ start:2094 stop:2972 length:879 start_codon:yes stop_codon:yes gene_type:complete